MRRVKTEIAIIGNGCAAMLAANKLISQGVEVALINPNDDFGVEDLRPYNGLGLWNAAYRSAEQESLPALYDRLIKRLKEVFPATLEQSGLTRGEHWSVLSSTPIHRKITEELEREFFKLERKPWSSGQFRLVNPEHVFVKTKRLGIDLTQVAQVEGSVVRSYGLWWDAPKMAFYLSQFIRNKGLEQYVGASIEGRYGRKVVVRTKQGEEVSIESERALLIFLSGELLPQVRSIVSACDEPWIQAVRKRRREQHFVWFKRAVKTGVTLSQSENFWLELGSTKYRWSQEQGFGTWSAERGPDGLERVVDEALRVQNAPGADARFTRASRAFCLEWDWKYPQWRETSHQTHWATSYEGDLWGILELLWNIPLY